MSCLFLTNGIPRLTQISWGAHNRTPEWLLPDDASKSKVTQLHLWHTIKHTLKNEHRHRQMVPRTIKYDHFKSTYLEISDVFSAFCPTYKKNVTKWKLSCHTDFLEQIYSAHHFKFGHFEQYANWGEGLGWHQLSQQPKSLEANHSSRWFRKQLPETQVLLMYEKKNTC